MKYVFVYFVFFFQAEDCIRDRLVTGVQTCALPIYIFTMQGLTKAYPGGKKVFENIWLSFFPDAKIGVVGVNGSGKSTLLKIMSGLDNDFTGEAFPMAGTKMGYLEQE